MITKISRSEIRTTSVTGLGTDVGIELGKMLYWNTQSFAGEGLVKADKQKLALLGSLLLSFIAGGLAGAIGFKYLGFISSVPLAIVLLTLAVVPLADDVRGERY